MKDLMCFRCSYLVPEQSQNCLGWFRQKPASFKVPEIRFPVFCNVNVTADPGEDPPVMSILELVAGVKLNTGANPEAAPDKLELFEVIPPSATDRDAE